MIGKGSTVIVIKAKDGSVFGGYADERWECGTEWYGNSSNFLFRLTEGYGGWPGTTANGHYQYLCWGKKTLPNGMGLGGQFEYAGLWMETDFMHGHSRGGPLCTTFDSPRLSREENFLVDEVEVWLVKPLKRDENEEAMEGGGVLSHAQDMEFMEMAGKKMYSKNLGPDASGKHKA
ncbi:TLD-domain-containing protein [Mucor mucedo]|uniref:TLD-domain-containing protein n=1 Tax=Mucor mucedo TaxID=29922 RepID=UPI00221F523D|nr:TLD-domain-containing protein [Mucor mucedo]KAI7891710.1 TLD-domain-containing protein [Mucor mucedo]